MTHKVLVRPTYSTLFSLKTVQNSRSVSTTPSRSSSSRWSKAVVWSLSSLPKGSQSPTMPRNPLLVLIRLSMAKTLSLSKAESPIPLFLSLFGLFFGSGVWTPLIFQKGVAAGASRIFWLRALLLSGAVHICWRGTITQSFLQRCKSCCMVAGAKMEMILSGWGYEGNNTVHWRGNQILWLTLLHSFYFT
jgi:hypothetical protein